MIKAAKSVPCTQGKINISEANLKRFWQKVDKRDSNECWLWRGAIGSAGYGSFQLSGKIHTAHRSSWIIHNGQIPHDGSAHGICVCHRCDVRHCVNPAHLFLGTHTDNMRDRNAKGRANMPSGDNSPARLHPELMPRGEANGRARLTAQQVLEIRSIYAAGGITMKKLGAQYGVINTLIHKIIHRKIWKHLP